MQLYWEELYQELVGVEVTHSALRVQLKELWPKLIFMIWLFLYVFNKQKPWYFNYFDTVKESVEEMLVMLKAVIKMLIPALLVLGKGKSALAVWAPRQK